VFVGRNVGQHLQDAEVDVRLGGERAQASLYDTGFFEGPVPAAGQAATRVTALAATDEVGEPADLPRQVLVKSFS
jgi:hypothetical protein